MALYLKVRDNRWQFSFGSKYMAIADVLADPGTAYTAGGTPLLISNREPEIKAQRAPWFSVFVGQGGITAAYIPSDYPPPAGKAPSTTLNNANQGKLQIFVNGAEITSADLSATLVPGTLQGMLIFQGME